MRPSGDLRLKIENVLNAAGQLAQFFNVCSCLLIGNQTALFAQGNGQAEQDNQLGRERFGRGNADFCTGACVQYQFAFTRQGGFHHVTNRQAVFVSQGLRVFQGFHGVQSFAGLGNGDDQLFRIGNHVAVAVFAGDFHVGRHFGDGFEPVFGGQRGIVGRTAGKDFDAVDIVEHFACIRAEVFRFETAVQEDFGSIGDGARLFVDFFLHEVAVWAQLQRSQRQFGHFNCTFGLRTGFVEQFFDAVCVQQGDVAVFQVSDAAGKGDHGGYVGSNKGFLVTQGHQQRAAHARNNHLFRVVLCDNGNGVCTVETGSRSLNGFKQFAAVLRVFVVDAVGDDFGIGLRFEGVTQRLQAFAFGFEVFDDAVVDNRNHAAGNVRVGVRLGYTAVGCPTGVADADMAEHAFFACCIFHQLNTADTADAFDFAVHVYGNTRRIIASVFKAFETVGQKIDYIVIGANSTYDTAHISSLVSKV